MDGLTVVPNWSSLVRGLVRDPVCGPDFRYSPAVHPDLNRFPKRKKSDIYMGLLKKSLFLIIFMVFD